MFKDNSEMRIVLRMVMDYVQDSHEDDINTLFQKYASIVPQNFEKSLMNIAYLIKCLIFDVQLVCKMN